MVVLFFYCHHAEQSFPVTQRSSSRAQLRRPSEACLCGNRGLAPARRAPRDTALRRRRLQLAQQLKTIAQLQEQANELRAEISSLESIIGAQADAIDALSRQNQEPED